MYRIFIMLFCLLMFPVALYQLSLLEILIGCFIGWLCFGIGISTVLHRYVSHKSFEFKNKFYKFISYVLAFMSGLGDPVLWGLIHRQHHKYTDTVLDTQAPLIIGKFRTFLSAFAVPSGTEYSDKQRRLLSEDKFNNFLSKYQMIILPLYPITVYILFGFNIFLILIGLVIPVAFMMQGYINAFLHSEPLTDGLYSKDMGGSFFWFGENLHKSHHIKPKNFYYTDWDLAKYYIKLVGKQI